MLKRIDKPKIEYDIALSFAGEDRKYAAELAEMLKLRNIRAHYDKNEKAKMWGKDLYEYLADIYLNKAHFCVIFISKFYIKKLWTKHERKNAQARAFHEEHEYILPIKLDDTVIPGIPDTVGYLDIREDSMEKIADSIEQKLEEIKSKLSRNNKSKHVPRSTYLDEKTDQKLFLKTINDIKYSIEKINNRFSRQRFFTPELINLEKGLATAHLIEGKLNELRPFFVNDSQTGEIFSDFNYLCKDYDDLKRSIKDKSKENEIFRACAKFKCTFDKLIVKIHNCTAQSENINQVNNESTARILEFKPYKK